MTDATTDADTTDATTDADTTDTDTTVRRTIVVRAGRARAFAVFTEGIGTWWPPEHHILQAELAEMVFEPRVGGRIVDRGVDGSECAWSRVLAYDPPDHFVMSWDIGLDWQIETDPSRTSEIEVTFTDQGDGTTLVALEHRHLDRHGDGWQGMRSAVADPNGWQVGLDRLAATLAG
jgi:uncharacterized protein YndB with AHSA1/START domain